MRHPLVFPLVLVFYEIAIYLSNDMYLPAVPDIMKDLALTMSQVQLTLTLWFIGAAFMPLVVGVLTEKYGRRQVLFTGGVIYIVASIVCALTDHFPLMLLARIVQGSMMATMLVPGYAIIHELYEEKEAIKLLAMMGSMTIIAPALGPLLGSFILLASTWRGIFWVIALVAAIPLILLMKMMPKNTVNHSGVTPSFKALMLEYKQVITNRLFMVRMSILGCIFVGWIAWITVAPLLIIETYHLTPVEYSLIQAAIFMVYIIGNHSVKYFLARFETIFMISVGLLSVALGAAWMLLFSWVSHSLLGFVLGMAFFAYGSGLSFAPLNRRVIESSQASMSIRMALFSVFLTGYCALGSIFMSLFFNGQTFSLAVVIAASAAMALLLHFTSAGTKREACGIL